MDTNNKRNHYFWRCDSKLHCYDASDESGNCTLVIPECDYSVDKPPIANEVVEEGTEVPNTIITAHVTIRKTSIKSIEMIICIK